MSGRTRRYPNRPRRCGAGAFTLVELLLVLVILSVLAVVVVPKFTGRSQQARITAAKTDISNIKLALSSFEIDCSRFPTTQEGLEALIKEPSGVIDWKEGGYLEKQSVPKDPWGNEYVYRCPGQHHTGGYDLYSLGPDGQQGGGDDITNWDEDDNR